MSSSSNLEVRSQHLSCSFQNGQTTLSIALRLGYIKRVTEQEVTTTTTTTVAEKYRANTLDSMQETFMSHSEDEGGKCAFKMRVLFSN